MKDNIREDLLHYVWRVKNFDHNNLLTTSGQSIEIISYGDYNTNAGPDFLKGTIKIDDIIWAGHIEMHINSSDWIQHNHSSNPAYDNVILHVVLTEDVSIKDKENNPIPCLQLGHRIPLGLINKYRFLLNTQSWIPCESLIDRVPEITISSLQGRMVAERLQQKADDLLISNQNNGSNFIETIYQRLGWAFGLSVNSEAFLKLCHRTPLAYILKHKDDLTMIEALLLGQSGLLNEATSTDSYVSTLRQEYSFLKSKFSLLPMNAVEWKFMRMRPSGFPTIRIAQFARLLFQTPRLDELIIEANIEQMTDALKITLSDNFWMTHYTLDESSSARKKSIGTEKTESIIINAMAPLLFAYGLYKGSDLHKERAIELLETIPAEKNNIIAIWKKLNIACATAADSQALLHLKKHYCAKSRCLECAIGHRILRE